MDICSDEWIITNIDMVVRVCTQRAGGMKEFGPRRYYGLVCQLSGATRYDVEGLPSLLATKGQILYLRKGVPYKVSSPEPSECIAVNFHLYQDADAPAFLLTPRAFALWRDSFSEMLSVWNTHRPGHMARCRALLYQMLAMLAEQSAEQALPAKRLGEIREMGEFLRENLSDARLTVEQAATQIRYSETHIRNQFRNVYGMTPKEYLIRLRISRARELLTATELSVSQIAQQCGYESLYSFSRAFRQATGYSPLHYRNQN